MIITTGLNINDSDDFWCFYILKGLKTIETRNQNNLRSLIGKPIGVIQTGRGKARVMGFIKLGQPKIYRSIEEFRKDEHRHLVKPNTKYDWKGIKYGYPVTVIKELDEPIPVTSRGIVTRKIKPYEIR